MGQFTGRLSPYVLFAGMTLLLSFVYFLNNGFLYFYDSAVYYSVGYKAFAGITERVLDMPGMNSDDLVSNMKAAQSLELDPGPESEGLVHVRSGYYSLLVFLLGAGPWLVLMKSAVLTSQLIIFARIFLSTYRRTVLMGAVVVLVMFSPVSYVLATQMPDIFAGILILSVSLLLVYWQQLGKTEKTVLIIGALMAVFFHQSHILLSFGMMVVSGLWAFLNRNRVVPKQALICIFAVFVSGLAGKTIVEAGINHYYELKPGRIPFLAGRVVADGPGHWYLQENCSDSEYILCKYTDKMPIGIDDFLWNDKPEKSIVVDMTNAERIQLMDEELDFVAKSVMAYPLEQIAASIGNTFRQFTSFGLEEFYYDPDLRRWLLINHAGLEGTLEDHMVGNNLAFLEGASYVMEAFVVVTLIYLAAVLVREQQMIRSSLANRLRRDKTLFKAQEKDLILLILCGVFLNAAICGMLSEPHDRYQARVVWILEWMAILTFVRRFIAAKREQAQSSGTATETP